MKKLFTFLPFCCILANAQVFSENFNSNTLAGWTVENPDTSFNWQVNSQAGFASFPSGAAFFDDDDAGPSSVNSKARITSPVIDLSTIASPKLSFKYANMIYDLNSRIKVEVFNGTAWTEVFNNPGSSGVWTIDFSTLTYILTSYAQADNIDLTPYKNANFRLRFVYDDAGDYSYGCAIDDVSISGATLAVSDVSKSGFSVYPNPVKDYIFISKKNINEKFVSIKIIDISGKTVKVFTNEAEKYDLSDLQKGTYILTLETDKSVEKKKLIKQ